MTKNWGMGCSCIGSEAECQGFPRGCKEAATAPGMLLTFKKEGGKLALASGNNSFLSLAYFLPLSLLSELYHVTPLAAEEAGMQNMSMRDWE